MTGVGTNVDAEADEEPGICDMGTDPGGRIAKT